MTLTVTHWLLHHHVTVEFQGSMGKFVQLSTQIRTYRNCGGGLCVCVSVCPCVYTEIQVSLRTDRGLETCKKVVSHRVLTVAAVLGEYLRLKEKLLPAYCTGLRWFPLLNRPRLDLSPFVLCESPCRGGHQTQLLGWKTMRKILVIYSWVA